MDLPQLRDYLASWPVAISLDDLSETLDLGLESKFLAGVFRQDSRFLLVPGQPDKCPVLVPNAALFRWFVWLNLRLAASRQFKITKKHVTHFLNNRLLPDGKWGEPPPHIISWGAVLHLVRPSSGDGCCLFPLARVLSFMSSDTLTIAIDVLEDFAERNVWDTSIKELRDQSMEEAFAVCPKRSVEVVRLREGLHEDSDLRLTLEGVGQTCGLTRERIRQIEKEFYDSILQKEVANIVRIKRSKFQWELLFDGKVIQRAGRKDRLNDDLSESKLRRKLASRLVAALLCEVLASGDVTMKTRSPRGNRREFLAKCCGIPVAVNKNWQIVGMESDRFRSTLRDPTGKARKTLNDIAEGIKWVTAELEKDAIAGDIRNYIRANWYGHLGKTEKSALGSEENRQASTL